MKKISIIIFAIILGTFSSFAQAPERISYQAEVRNSSNALVVSAPVKIRLSVLQTTSTGTAVYVETHNPTTSANGIVNIQLGGGAVVSGVFTNINWASGPYFLKSEVDPANNTVPNYTSTATSQLLSVPYSLYSKASGNPKILNGTVNPTIVDGATGDYYINSTTNTLFGPRISTGWPTTGVSLGRSLLNGTSAPASTLGNAGDYYLNRTTNILIGPKTTTWPSTGINLNGSVLSGTTNPANTLGVAGDYYLNKTTNQLIGPKTTVWPTTKNPNLFEHYVGELWGGGIVFNVWKDAAGVEHGLIATLTNQSTGTQIWSNVTTNAVSIETSDGLGASNLIVNQPGHTNSAAKLCLDLVQNGQSDWYLPTTQELFILSANAHTLNKVLSANISYQTLLNVNYISSNDKPAYDVYPASFFGVSMFVPTLIQAFKPDLEGCYVRAIRKF